MKKTILTRTVTHRQFVRMVLSITILLVAVIILTCALYGKVIIARNQTYVEGMLTRYRDSLTAQIEEYVQPTTRPSAIIFRRRTPTHAIRPPSR